MQSSTARARAFPWKRAGLGLAVALAVPGSAMAQDASHPVIPGYGAVRCSVSLDKAVDAESGWNSASTQFIDQSVQRTDRPLFVRYVSVRELYER